MDVECIGNIVLSLQLFCMSKIVLKQKAYLKIFLILFKTQVNE